MPSGRSSRPKASYGPESRALRCGVRFMTRSPQWIQLLVCVLLIASTSLAQAPTPVPDIDENAVVVTAVPTMSRAPPTLRTPFPRPDPTEGEQEATQWVPGVDNEIMIAIYVGLGAILVLVCVKLGVNRWDPHERNLRKIEDSGVVVVLKPIEELPRRGDSFDAASIVAGGGLGGAGAVRRDVPLREQPAMAVVREDSESELSKMEHELNVDLTSRSRSRSRRNSHSRSRRNSHSRSQVNSHSRSRSRRDHSRSRRNSRSRSRRNSHSRSRSHHRSRAASPSRSHHRSRSYHRDAVVIDVRDGELPEPFSAYRRPNLGDELLRQNRHRRNLSPRGTRGVRSRSDESRCAAHRHHTEPMGQVVRPNFNSISDYRHTAPFGEQRRQQQVHISGATHLSSPSSSGGHRRTRSVGDRPGAGRSRSPSHSRRRSRILNSLLVSADPLPGEPPATRVRKHSASRSRTAEPSHKAYDDEQKLSDYGHALSPSEKQLETRRDMMTFVPMVTLSPKLPKYSAPTIKDEGVGALQLEPGEGQENRWQTIVSL